MNQQFNKFTNLLQEEEGDSEPGSQEREEHHRLQPADSVLEPGGSLVLQDKAALVTDRAKDFIYQIREKDEVQDTRHSAQNYQGVPKSRVTPHCRKWVIHQLHSALRKVKCEQRQ